MDVRRRGWGSGDVCEGKMRGKGTNEFVWEERGGECVGKD